MYLSSVAEVQQISQKQTPEYAKMFNVIDSFDTHAKIPSILIQLMQLQKESGHIGIISVGWDPGMFSLKPSLCKCNLFPTERIIHSGARGVSQGHFRCSTPYQRRKRCKQYTIPVEAALEAVRNGEKPELTTRQKDTRECFVVAEEGADLARLRMISRLCLTISLTMTQLYILFLKKN